MEPMEPDRQEIFKWANDILDKKSQGIVIVAKIDDRVDGGNKTKIEAKVTVNNVHRMLQLKSIISLFQLEPEEVAVMQMFLRKGEIHE